MGDIHQVAWVHSLLPLAGPVLEVGSKREPDNPAFFDYRTLFPEGTEYTGVDIAEGLGVDEVCDLSDSLHSRLRYERDGYSTVLCLSTLEHVREPWNLAKNLLRKMTSNAVLVVSAPFSWPLHDFPDDYWRFSPSGIRALFPEVEFDLERSTLTSVSGRGGKLLDALDHLRYPGMVYGEAGLHGVVFTDAYILQPKSLFSEGVNVNMVGRRAV